MNNKNKHSFIISIFVFCILLLLFLIGTFYPSNSGLFTAIRKSIDNRQLSSESIESEVKDTFLLRNEFIDFAGIVYKVMGRRLSNDGQFYRDTNNLIHLKNNGGNSNTLIDTTAYLANELKHRGIPFFVCQTAERAAYGDSSSGFIDSNSLNYIEPLKAKLEGTDSVIIDYTEELQKASFSADDIFFHTDIHYQTRAEFYMLEVLIKAIEDNTNLSFRNKKDVFDLQNYSIESYPFLGNLAFSFGRYFVGLDEFQYYIPLFETSFHLENTQGSSRDGSFENVILNGQRNDLTNNNNPHVYRIVDYMQYPSPSYTITNNLIDDGHVLVVGCSMPMRTNAYLSLLCHEVTVLDPRSFYSHDYLKDALEKNYDAVILYSSSNLIDGIGGYDAEIVSYNYSKADSSDQVSVMVSVRNTGTSVWNNTNLTRLCMWINGVDIGLRLDLPNDCTIYPGECITFTSTELLPTNCQLIEFQMLREGMYYFGERCRYIDLEISKSTYSKMVSEVEYGKWIGKSGICLDYCNGVFTSNEEIPLKNTDTELVLNGWAADFVYNKPFDKLYLIAGENVCLCNYGLNRESVVAYYGLESLRYTGFEVSIPAEWILQDQTLGFIGISMDGQVVYEPVYYTIKINE